jgi:D-glycero-alpha-D-manno-heptose-7-phosphate kinase
MNICKTPLRMSFVGGGSDLPAYYKQFGGAVLSTTINKYIYIGVNKKFDGRIRVSYTKTEEVDCVSMIEHPLVRHALDVTGVKAGIEIVSMADIPAKGSGLGSSSSFTVALLHSLYAFQGIDVSKEVLARQACAIEIDRCGEPIGKQDQYAAAYGGLNLIKFMPDESVLVDPIICSCERLQEIENSILMFYTGRTRSASSVLAGQSRSIMEPKRQRMVGRMVELSYELKRVIESESLASFGAILDENWRLKRQLDDGISDPQIDEWYFRGMANGATGGKLLGAGSGGFMIFFCSPDRRQSIIDSLPELMPTRFAFDRVGSQVLYSESDSK